MVRAVGALRVAFRLPRLRLSSFLMSAAAYLRSDRRPEGERESLCTGPSTGQSDSRTGTARGAVPHVLTMQRHEPKLQSLARHEVRWMRLIRVLRPRSFRLLFITFSVPLALIGVVLSAAQPSLAALAVALFQTTVLTRLALHFVNRLLGERPAVREFWLLRCGIY